MPGYLVRVAQSGMKVVPSRRALAAPKVMARPVRQPSPAAAVQPPAPETLELPPVPSSAQPAPEFPRQEDSAPAADPVIQPPSEPIRDPERAEKMRASDDLELEPDAG